MKKKIALVMPYFGNWPEWIDLYFYSCNRNRMIDFLIYTDCPVKQTWKKYNNVHFQKLSFQDYCTLVSTKLEINFHPVSAYKLCDLRPFYGIIHQPDLCNYDFWGFGDCDLVYGDMSVLINDKNLRKYDLLTTHSYHIAGHFTIMRNNLKYRNLGLNIENWKELLINENWIGLDENQWSYLTYRKLKWVRIFHKYVTKKMGIGLLDYLDKANKLFCNRFTKRHFKEYNTTPNPSSEQNCAKVWRYNVQNGKIFDPQGVELIYLHFLFFKKTPYLDTEHYWKDGYWQVSDNDYTGIKEVFFNCEGVSVNL
jgi:hypothetical protein